MELTSESMDQSRKHVVELTTAQIDTLQRLLCEDSDRFASPRWSAAGPIESYLKRQAHYRRLFDTLAAAKD